MPALPLSDVAAVTSLWQIGATRTFNRALAPLRQRGGDVAVLTKHFLGCRWVLGEGVAQVLQRYPWPGNVRQLFNVLERACVLAEETGTIGIKDLPQEIVEIPLAAPPAAGSLVDLETLNQAHVIGVLEQCNGNKAKASRALGIHRRSLYRLLDKYGLSDRDAE